ncbi:MAG TPA: M23 family metallopeptidase [Myxococcota bacterium]|nr:M23 family metallopeptidase [Myxococcota bacterium]HRY93494.1 M23 family metallopeptidase [Myxococcota bacterium]HSA20734.1 M23 family metallopeptidase [Myxococcota bacterium]
MERSPRSPGRSPGRPRGRNPWPWLVGGLLLLNIYLFGIRGLPRPQAPEPAAAPAAASPPGEAPFRSALGEIRGVAGVRLAHAQPARTAALTSGPRFDLEAAEGVAGQRAFTDWCEPRAGQIGRGETFGVAVMRAGLDGPQTTRLVDALRDVLDFRRCREGDAFELLVCPGGGLQRFVYRKSAELAYRVDRRGERLEGRREERRAEVELAEVGVRIERCLYCSLEDALVAELVDIFAWDIDFYVDTQNGDTVRLLVERKRLDGKVIGYGRVLAAEYDGRSVGAHRALRYTSADGKAGFYDEQGGSLRKAFLKSPLKFARITSGFGTRVHPILGYSRVHAGIDFGAPTGTPVWAPADGTVLFAGRKGGYGNTVVLRHANGYQTLYAHLSSIKVKAGARVQQKAVIAAVGSTGLSTGPHLHYGMTLHGKNVSPMAQRFPPAEPVPRAELDAFRGATAPLLDRLGRIRLPGPIQPRDLAAAEGKGAG